MEVILWVNSSCAPKKATNQLGKLLQLKKTFTVWPDAAATVLVPPQVFFFFSDTLLLLLSLRHYPPPNRHTSGLYTLVYHSKETHALDFGRGR